MDLSHWTHWSRQVLYRCAPLCIDVAHAKWRRWHKRRACVMAKCRARERISRTHARMICSVSAGDVHYFGVSNDAGGLLSIKGDSINNSAVSPLLCPQCIIYMCRAHYCMRAGPLLTMVCARPLKVQTDLRRPKQAEFIAQSIDLSLG
jgi:hypothetical protein